MRAAELIVFWAVPLAVALTDADSAHAAPILRSITTATEPMYLTHAGDSRLFVVERRGVIRIFQPTTGAFLATPFLDIRTSVSTGGERGLLSMAFPPDYATTRYFWVYYTALNGDITIDRYRTTANANVADPASRVEVLTIGHSQFSNHNGGQLQFGPDGYLYIGTGDGGSGGDPLCNGQNRSSLLGKLLRLDVRGTFTSSPFYRVPTSNPFVGPRDPSNLVDDRIWAVGLRNPWRFSFDRMSGELYVGDVGQGSREEVDWEPAGSAGGRNYGWNRMEGSLCFSGSCSGTPCPDPMYTMPVHEYDHSSGNCSITGGYVYRGARVPEIFGRYVFVDYCVGNGRALRQTAPGTFVASALLTLGPGVVSFGEDASGDLYVLRDNDILRIESDSPPNVPAAPSGIISASIGAMLIAALVWLRRGRQQS